MKNRAMEITLGVVAIVAAIAAQWLIAALFALGAVALYEYHRSKIINPAAPAARLVCVLGNHVIGNEPFSFFSEDAKADVASKPYCLRCKDRLIARCDQAMAETDAFLKDKEKRWPQVAANGDRCPCPKESPDLKLTYPNGPRRVRMVYGVEKMTEL